MQEKILEELIFARIHAGPVFALVRIQENIFEEIFPEYCAKFLCRACIRTRANTGKYSWRIIYVLVSCQGVMPEGTLGPLARLVTMIRMTSVRSWSHGL